MHSCNYVHTYNAHIHNCIDPSVIFVPVVFPYVKLCKFPYANNCDST